MISTAASPSGPSPHAASARQPPSGGTTGLPHSAPPRSLPPLRGTRASWTSPSPKLLRSPRSAPTWTCAATSPRDGTTGTPLYRRISASIGEQRYQAWAYHNAPIRRWIRVHRARFEQLRNGTWRKPPAPQILTPSKRATAQATTEVPAGGTFGSLVAALVVTSVQPMAAVRG
jgi:hypothetical protein